MAETSTGLESRFDVAIEEALPRSPIGELICDSLGFVFDGSEQRAFYTKLIKEEAQNSKEWLQLIAKSSGKYLGQKWDRMNNRSNPTTVSVYDSQGRLVEKVKLRAQAYDAPVVPINHRYKSRMGRIRGEHSHEVSEGNLEDSILHDEGKNHLFLRAVLPAWGGYYIPCTYFVVSHDPATNQVSVNQFKDAQYEDVPSTHKQRVFDGQQNREVFMSTSSGTLGNPQFTIFMLRPEGASTFPRGYSGMFLRGFADIGERRYLLLEGHSKSFQDCARREIKQDLKDIDSKDIVFTRDAALTRDHDEWFTRSEPGDASFFLGFDKVSTEIYLGDLNGNLYATSLRELPDSFSQSPCLQGKDN